MNFNKYFIKKDAQDIKNEVCSGILMYFGDETYFHLYSILMWEDENMNFCS